MYKYIGPIDCMLMTMSESLRENYSIKLTNRFFVVSSVKWVS